MDKLLCPEYSEDSNTSHVPIYLSGCGDYGRHDPNSNTSHVPIYPNAKLLVLFLYPFKYISCSNLSVHPAYSYNALIYSNTSHVPIYP